MDRKEIKNIVKEAIHEDISSEFMKMLRDSEERINSTNSMINKLVETTASCQSMYNKHLESLEHSRDAALRSVEELIKANLELSRLLEQTKSDYKFIIQGYKDELHSAKDLYNNLLERYDRLNERRSNKGGAKAMVEIKK